MEKVGGMDLAATTPLELPADCKNTAAFGTRAFSTILQPGTMHYRPGQEEFVVCAEGLHA